MHLSALRLISAALCLAMLAACEMPPAAAPAEVSTGSDDSSGGSGY